MDIVKCLNCGFEDRSRKVFVIDRTEVTYEYLKFWFWVDVASAIPVDAMIMWGWVQLPGDMDLHMMAKMMKPIRLFRVGKILKLIRNAPIFAVLIKQARTVSLV